MASNGAPTNAFLAAMTVSTVDRWQIELVRLLMGQGRGVPREPFDATDRSRLIRQEYDRPQSVRVVWIARKICARCGR